MRPSESENLTTAAALAAKTFLRHENATGTTLNVGYTSYTFRRGENGVPILAFSGPVQMSGREFPSCD